MTLPALRRALLPALLCAACVPGGPQLSAAEVVHVQGRSVDAAGVRTVAQALHAAHVEVPAGRVLSAVTHRPVAGEPLPGQVLLDGRPVDLAAPVTAGDVVTVRPGRDVTEPLTVLSVPVPADRGLSTLYVGGRPGRSRLVRGALSGETVSQRLLVAPRPGRLVRPGAVALTFDDGPDPYWTPRILAVLARARVRATFCLIGRQAAAHPELVRAIAAGGHALCDHTWDHDEHLADRPPAVVARELGRTRTAILAAAGRAPVLFRAPGGGWSAALEAEARRQGMAALKWDVDPRDWSRPGTAAVVRVVLAQVRPGSVVLLHDGGGDRSQTLAALSVLLRELPARGYSFQLPQPPR